MVDEKKILDELKAGRVFYDEHQRIVLNEVIDFIEHFPKSDEWIPVEEALPNEGEAILISTHLGDLFVAFYNSFDRIWYVYDANGYDSKAYEVVAWMPLPKTYEVKKYD